MEVFKLFGSILIKSDEAESSMQKTESKAKKLASTLGGGIKTAAKWGAGIAAGAAAAATAAAGALLKVDEATQEYRESMGNLKAAWETAGGDAKLAKQAYEGLYKVVGKKDVAMEASQLLAQLANDEKAVADWADIAAGATTVFGESLPINSMIEYCAETATTGTVTGDLSRMLAQAGISEDEFNEKLQACSTTQERSKLITDTLSEAYSDATDSFKANNEEAIKTREVQAKIDEAMGKLGGTVSAVKTALMGEFAPALADIVSAFVDFTNGVDGAEIALQESIQSMVDKIVEKLPDFIDFGIEVIVAIATGLIQNLPYLISQLPKIVGAIVNGLMKLGTELYNTGKELFKALFSGLKSVWGEIGAWVKEKVDWLTDKLAFWRKGKTELDEDGGGSGRNSHAAGLAYVPYDNYPINAHRGEVLLNANDASGLLADIRALAKEGGRHQRITITVNSVLDGKVIGQTVTEYQNQQDRAVFG